MEEKFIEEATKVAKNATCLRSKCGSVIISNGEIIGTGFNSPPNNLDSERRCKNKKDIYDKKVSDKTCCIHAEQRAMFDALKRNPEKLVGSKIYFIRLDDQGNKKTSGKPYCTICSKMALDIGIKEFILYTKDGIKSYDTKEYNRISFNY